MNKPGSDHELLEALLTSWREHPAPELVAAIDTVSARLAARREPVSTRPTQAEGWRARAERLDAADVPVLLEALRHMVPASIGMGLQLMEKWPADPRVDAWLLDGVETPLSPGKRGRPLVDRTLALLERSNDPRVRERLIEFTGDPARLLRLSSASLQVFETTVERVRSKRYPPATLDAVGEKLVAAAKKPPAPGKRDGEALLRQVYAAPSDDAARLVYADWLTEQGDVRGEFITLQLTRAATGGAPTRRERELEKKWGRHWLGPLNDAVLKRGLVYRRGFLAECAIDYRSKEPPVGHPLFSTVEKMDLTSGRMGGVEYPAHPVCKALHTVVGLSGFTLGGLTRPVKHLGLSYFAIDQLPALAGQNELEVLELGSPQHEVEPLREFARSHPTLKTIIAPGLVLSRETRFE